MDTKLGREVGDGHGKTPLAFMDRLMSSYYDSLSVCAGENQGRNPIGKALVFLKQQKA